MKNPILLYLLVVAIWGSTWLSIKYQLGEVPPLQSVFYRFLLAAAILHIYVFWRAKMPKFSRIQHMYFAILGAFLFCLNYLGFYLAIELGLTTGLEAVIFSLLMIFNALNLWKLSKQRPKSNIIAGGIIGLIGVTMLFGNDLTQFNLANIGAIALAFIATYFASVGNLTSRKLQNLNVNVLHANTWGMSYGAGILGIMILISGQKFVFDSSLLYVGNLAYLSIFGSIIAFGSYLTLLGKIGAERAAYATIIIPIVALILSTIFEGYEWDGIRLLGVVIILAGNVIVMGGTKVIARYLKGLKNAQTET